MKVPFLDLPRQYKKIRVEVNRAMQEVLESQMFILGPTVEAFEKEVAAFCKVPHAVGVASGTDALLLALMALGVKSGDRVATVAYTFFATGGAVSTLGAKPLFVDIEPKTFNLDPNHLQDTLKKIRRKAERPKVIMPVHLFGQMADMRAIMEIARHYEIPVVEDAAQALGAWMEIHSNPTRPSLREVQMAGAVGDCGCFSFYPTKNLGAFGDGGMVISHNAEVAKKVRLLRVYGAKIKYHHQMIGINSRLDALQAAVLQVKLRYLPRWSEARRRNAARYLALFREAGLQPPTLSWPGAAKGQYHIYNQFVIRAKKRDALRECLTREGVGSDIYYPIPLHLQECYRYLGAHAGDLPVSEKAARESLALPIYPELTLRQQRRVVEVIAGFCRS
ncbi:MAG: DegT/DnrJ/EryC1/StrS family aminotransferase [Deltaproteobacteria bacterium]|nr:DegT/DnrJ/EryC1/StrS family aminotransferase [Deltaproteobacteria bacterium]